LNFEDLKIVSNFDIQISDFCNYNYSEKGSFFKLDLKNG